MFRITADLCGGCPKWFYGESARKAAHALDAIFASVLLIIGILGMTHNLHISAYGTGALLGIGSFGLGLFIYRLIVDCKKGKI